MAPPPSSVPGRYSDDGGEFELTPVFIGRDSTPAAVDHTSEDGRRIIDLMGTLSAEIGVDLEYDAGTITIASRVSDADARLRLDERTLSYPWLAKLQLSVYGDNPLELTDLLDRYH